MDRSQIGSKEQISNHVKVKGGLQEMERRWSGDRMESEEQIRSHVKKVDLEVEEEIRNHKKNEGSR